MYLGRIRSRCCLAFLLSSDMLFEGRWMDLCGQIHHAGSFLCFVAPRWWQVTAQRWLRNSRFPPNKVRKGSFDLGCSGQPWIWAVLRLLESVLRRSELIKRRRSGGFHKAESLLLCCSFFDLSPLASGRAELDGRFMFLARQREARLGGISGD